MRIRPLGDRLVLRRLEANATAKGGIVIPDTAKETSQEAEVVAVGSGRVNEHGTRVPLEVEAGDRVLVRRYAGTEIRIDGAEYLVVTEDEILGVLVGARRKGGRKAQEVRS